MGRWPSTKMPRLRCFHPRARQTTAMRLQPSAQGWRACAYLGSGIENTNYPNGVAASVDGLRVVPSVDCEDRLTVVCRNWLASPFTVDSVST